jgi:hypothetical protein
LSCVSLAKFFRIVLFCFVLFFFHSRVIPVSSSSSLLPPIPRLNADTSLTF